MLDCDFVIAGERASGEIIVNVLEDIDNYAL
jgi:hypothetical protein